MHIKNYSKQAFIVGLLMPVLLCSCASYNTRVTDYYSSLQNGQYAKALHLLEKNKLLKKERNKLLYLLEKGNLFHLMQAHESSNACFNTADYFIETKRKSLGDVSKSYLLNPMMQTYLGESFERLMIHYYKSLNYVALNKTDDAIVEARRITLSNNALSDQQTNKKKYNKDAFATNLQGMLYELNGDINNAFIAYRNAADIYLANGNSYYGVAMPNQLKQDVLRTASQMGFDNEVQRYERLLNTTLNSTKTDGGSLIVFVEKGTAPVKKEQNFTLTQNKNGINGYYYFDEFGNQVNVPFDYGYYSLSHRNNNALQDFRIFRIAIPYYELTYTNKMAVGIMVQQKTYTTETAQDFNTLAVKVLKERFLTEMANAIARQMTKRLTEYAAQKGTESASKSNSKETDDKKKERKAKSDGEIAGLVMNLINNATEKADTRNWQSLPAYIDYIRIPLQKGENQISILGNAPQSFTVNGNGSLQIMSIKK